jgi:hypothetical protein
MHAHPMHTSVSSETLQLNMNIHNTAIRIPPASAAAGPRASLFAVIVDAFRRPLFFLALLYGIAIAYERIVEVEIYKPYRIIGVLLVIGVVLARRFRIDNFTRLVGAYLGIGLVLALGNLFEFERNADEVVRNYALLWGFNLATYVAVVCVVRSRRDVIVLAIVHAVALMTAAYDIAQDARLAEVTMRQMGDFKNPANGAISMLFTCLVIVAALKAFAAGSLFKRLLVVVASAAVSLFLLYTATLTGSRSGTALLAVGLLFFVLARTRQRLLLQLFLAGGVALVLLTMNSLNLSSKLSTAAEGNILAARVETKGLDTDRLYLWRAGLDALADTYGLGLGVAGYQAVHKEYFATYAYLSDPRWLNSDLSLHNDYVTALVEHGVVGFVLFIMLCAHLLRTALYIEHREVRAIALALLLGLAVNGLSHNGLPYFAVWFYFALLVAWRRSEAQAGAKRVRVPPLARRSHAPH